MSKTVVDLRGQSWRIRRRWVPRLGVDTLWSRFRNRVRRGGKRASRTADVADRTGLIEFLSESIAMVLFVIAAVLFLFFVAFPVLMLILDVILIVVLLIGGVIARVLFRRPWVVEARAADGQVLSERVVGWRASGTRVQDLASEIQRGVTPGPSSTERARMAVPDQEPPPDARSDTIRP